MGGVEYNLPPRLSDLLLSRPAAGPPGVLSHPDVLREWAAERARLDSTVCVGDETLTQKHHTWILDPEFFTTYIAGHTRGPQGTLSPQPPGAKGGDVQDACDALGEGLQLSRLTRLLCPVDLGGTRWTLLGADLATRKVHVCPHTPAGRASATHSRFMEEGGIAAANLLLPLLESLFPGRGRATPTPWSLSPFPSRPVGAPSSRGGTAGLDPVPVGDPPPHAGLAPCPPPLPELGRDCPLPPFWEGGGWGWSGCLKGVQPRPSGPPGQVGSDHPRGCIGCAFVAAGMVPSSKAQTCAICGPRTGPLSPVPPPALAPGGGVPPLWTGRGLRSR